jgi:hypothetical protein
VHLGYLIRGDLAIARNELLERLLRLLGIAQTVLHECGAAKAAGVEAVVVENVTSAAGVLVPAGSKLVCSSRVSKDGRVPLSCDAIRTANRSWSFSGLAVGEGQHFGLRVVDTAVPAGSSFVVYVDAEFR